MTDSIGIWIVRNEARTLGERLATTLGAQLHLPEKHAVRYLQGLAKDKATDPGVVVLDEGGRFAISLLGGHEGGANRLAYRVANCSGAVPVITTATETLKPLVLGIGCRRDITIEAIDGAVSLALKTVSRSRHDVREVATVDL